MGLDPASLAAQTRQSLEKERLEIIQRIENSDNALIKVSSTKKASLKDFRLLERKIKDREKLISTIQNELIITERELSEQRQETEALRTDLSKIKDRYYSLLNGAYKQYHSYNKWAFIFNAKSINDSFQRWKYTKQYEAYCKAEYENLQGANQAVLSSIESLNTAVEERQSLLDQESSQFELIKQEMVLKDSIIKSLNDQEDELKQDIQDQKAARERLNAAIENYIIAVLQGKESTSSTEIAEPKPNSTSKSFEQLKSKLPWPTNSGIIVGRFGRQKHPTLKDVYISNNGVDIQSNGENTVSAVHAGTVVGISEIPGFAKTIIVKHESYYTVYSKLSEVYIVEKQSIEQGTTLGEIVVDDEGQRVMHFEVWKGKNKLNPLGWLKSK